MRFISSAHFRELLLTACAVTGCGCCQAENDCLRKHVVQHDGPPVNDVIAPVPAVGVARGLPSAHGPMVGIVPLPGHLKDRQHLQ